MKVIPAPNGVRYVGVIDSSAHQFAYDPPARLRPGAKKPNFQPMVDRGIAGLIHRIGNGLNQDPAWDMVCAEAERVGMPLSGYYYLQPNKLSADDAVKLILKWVDGHKLGLPLMLDCESYDGAAVHPSAMGEYKNRLVWLLTKAMGVTPIVYTYASWWAIKVSGQFASYDSVQARYPRGDEPCPSNLDEWVTWIPWSKVPTNSTSLGPWEGWQFTSSGLSTDFGFPSDGGKRLDLNVFTEAAFNRLRAPFIAQPKPPIVIPPQPTTGPFTAPITTIYGDTMQLALTVPKQTRILDTRNNPGSKVTPMAEVTIPRPNGITSDVKAYSLSVILIDDDPIGQANIQFKQTDGSWVGSQGNTDIGLATSQSTAIVPAQADGSVVFRTEGAALHVVIDLIGYYTPLSVTGTAPVTEVVSVVTGVTTKDVKVVK